MATAVLPRAEPALAACPTCHEPVPAIGFRCDVCGVAHWTAAKALACSDLHKQRAAAGLRGDVEGRREMPVERQERWHGLLVKLGRLLERLL
jgi:hypothetical protein